MKIKSWLNFNHKYWTAFLLIAVFIIETRKGYFKGLKNYLRCLSWKPYGLIFLATALAVIPVIFFDSILSQQAQSLSSPVSNFIRDFGSYLGKGQNLWMILGIFYTTFYILRFDRLRQIAFSALLASFLTSLLATLFKFTVLRARPNTEFGPFSFLNWKGVIEDNRLFQSFPSGDVAVIAGAAGYLFLSVKNRYWGWLILLLPLCTAFARVSLNRHWPSDTLGAIGLGIIGAKFIWDFQKKKLPQ